MGILDEAIREHLELKRQHGADDSELKQLEDQALRPARAPGRGEPDAERGRPRAMAAGRTRAEAPTEFMAQPEALGPRRRGPALGPPPRREPAAGMADIQEPPEPRSRSPRTRRPTPRSRGRGRAGRGRRAPAAEEQPAAEHEAVRPGAAPSHTTEERHAIADQPTEMFDVEEEFAATEAPAPARRGPGRRGDQRAPPRPGRALATPPTVAIDEDEDDEDDFFDEQRLSDELDQALEAPADRRAGARLRRARGRRAPPTSTRSPAPDEHEAVARTPRSRRAAPRHERRRREAASDEDVLEETPDFLEETPEDDQLWFEQKPPKDFDFDD